MIRALIADDHVLVRAGLRQLLVEDRGVSVVAEAGSGDELLERLARGPVDVVLLDIAMPGPPFLEVLRRLKSGWPDLRVLVVSMHPEGQIAVRAIQAGADGYITKSQSPDELLRAVRKVHAGGKYVSPPLAEELAAALASGVPGGPLERLSGREREIMSHLTAGRSMKEIAAACGVSPKTVSTYRARVLQKLGLRGNVELIRFALEQGMT